MHRIWRQVWILYDTNNWPTYVSQLKVKDLHNLFYSIFRGSLHHPAWHPHLPLNSLNALCFVSCCSLHDTDITPSSLTLYYPVVIMTLHNVSSTFFSLSLLLCHMMMSNDKATVKAHVQRHAHAVYLYLSTQKHTERQAEQAKSKRNDCPGENRQCFFSLQSSSFTTSHG